MAFGLARLGWLARWQRVRSHWFVPDAHGALLLIAIVVVAVKSMKKDDGGDQPLQPHPTVHVEGLHELAADGADELLHDPNHGVIVERPTPASGSCARLRRSACDQ